MNLLDLAVKIGVEDNASGKISEIGSSIKNGLGNAAKAGAVAIGAGITAVSAGAVAFGKAAFEAYSSYEQLAGGVAKLYGAAGQSLEEFATSQGQTVEQAETRYSQLMTAQSRVMQNASKAYKTAGMSANKYMEIATSFSASLINSLGGNVEEAARLTDVAMVAISDNVNTFGTDMEAVQGAFQGFAKQNYTMLDNLKLGYGGTKTEMERLIKDANEYAASIGQASDLSIDSFADIVKAIDLVQQKQQIAGTTSREAATTMEGSLNMLKAAWENLQTAIADPEQGLQQAFDALFESAQSVVKNAAPLIGNIIKGMSEALTNNVPQFVSTLGEFFQTAFGDVWPDVKTSLASAVKFAVDNFSIDNVIEFGGQVAQGIQDGIRDFGTIFPEDAQWITDDAADALETVSNVIGSIVGWAKEHQVVEKLSSAIKAISDGIRDLVQHAQDVGMIDQVGDALGRIWDTVSGDVENTNFNNISDFLGFLVDIAGPVAGAVATIVEVLSKLNDAINDFNDATERLGILTPLNLVDTIGNIGRAISDLSQGKTPEGNVTFDQLIERFSALGHSAENTEQTFATSFGNMSKTTEESSERIGGGARAAGEEVERGFDISGSVSNFMGNLSSMVSKIGETNQASGTAFDGLKSKIDKESDTSTAQSNMDGFVSKVASVRGTVVQDSSSMMTGMNAKITSGSNEAVTTMGGVPGRIKGQFNGSSSLLVPAGNSIVSGLLSGIKGSIGSVYSFVSGIGATIASLKGPKEYDLKLLVPAGNWIMQGLNTGLREGFNVVTKTLSGITSAIGSTSFGGVTSELTDQLKTATNSFNQYAALIKRTGIAFNKDFVEKFAKGSDEYKAAFASMANMTDEQANRMINTYKGVQLAEELESQSQCALWIQGEELARSKGKTSVETLVSIRGKTLDLAEAMLDNKGMAAAFEKSTISIDTFVNSLESADTSMSSFISKFDKMVDKVADGFSKIDTSSMTSAREWVYNLTTNERTYENYVANLQRLMGKLDKTADNSAFINALTEGGMEKYGKIVQEMAGYSSERLQKIAQNYANNITNAGVNAIKEAETLARGATGTSYVVAQQQAQQQQQIVTQNISFNQPVKTPAETSRELKLLAMYGGLEVNA